MTPEVEALLNKCHVSKYNEEFTHSILSTAPCDLTLRLIEIIQTVQNRSPLFPRIRKGKNRWFVVMPERVNGNLRVVSGRDIVNFILVFPDLDFSRDNLSTETIEEFEKKYVITFLEKIEGVKAYEEMLTRCYALTEIETGLLYRTRDLLCKSVEKVFKQYQVTGAADERQRIKIDINDMKLCLLAINKEIAKRGSG